MDADRDVILFPDDAAAIPQEVDWISCRRRVVVLESTWNAAKTMYRGIVSVRQEAGLPAIPCVKLEQVTGQYWRFHEEGNCAVSTIEAIAHLVYATSHPQEAEALLYLFHVQRQRVLETMHEGGKAPRAVVVEGVGEGSWNVHLID